MTEGISLYELPTQSKDLPNSIPQASEGTIISMLGKTVLEIQGHATPAFFKPSQSDNTRAVTSTTALGETSLDPVMIDQSCGDLECTVLERVPSSRDSGYSRQLVWLDREELRTMQIQFFDRRDAHLKTMVVEDYKQYLDGFWRSGKVTMTNHLTGKSTVLDWSGYEFGTDLDMGDFTRTTLKRAR